MTIVVNNFTYNLYIKTLEIKKVYYIVIII